MLVYHEYHVVRWGSPMTDAFIMTHPDFPNKDIYATYWMVQITEEGLEEYLLERTEKRSSLKPA